MRKFQLIKGADGALRRCPKGTLARQLVPEPKAEPEPEAEEVSVNDGVLVKFGEGRLAAYVEDLRNMEKIVELGTLNDVNLDGDLTRKELEDQAVSLLDAQAQTEGLFCAEDTLPGESTDTETQ